MTRHRQPATLLLTTAGALLFTPSPAASQGLPSRDSVTAFVDVSVLPIDRDRILERQTVIVRGTTIETLGPAASTRIPAGARRIDGRGKYLMPGLVDMHAHFMGGAGNPTDGAGHQFIWFLANGVTTARGLGGPPAYLTTRDRANRGEVLAPRLYAAGGSIHGQSVKSPTDAGNAVRAAKTAGYDWIKTHGGFRITYDSMTAAAKTAGIPVSGHVSHGYGLLHALASGQQVEHLDGYLAVLAGDTGTAGAWNDGQIVLDPSILARVDESKIPAVVAATRRSGTCAGPTLALFRIIASGASADTMAAWPEMRFVPKAVRAAFEQQVQQFPGGKAGDPAAERYLTIRDRIVKSLYDAGVPLLAGGDSPQFFLVPGFSLHRELEAFRLAGIPPYGILAAATVNAARCLGAEREFGTVAPGQRADLLLLNDDPRRTLAARQSMAGVMTQGR